MAANAAGNIAPGMVMFAYERIPLGISASMPKSFAIGKSESGWMTAETFYEYITNVFYPCAVKIEIEFPIIFFIDGHSSHLTLPLSDFCTERKIILIALDPNSTHITQPMDVAVFRSLKNCWRNEINNWRIHDNGSKIKKENFGPVLAKTIGNSITPKIILNGFRTAGLCPFNADAINYQKYFKSNITEI
ncbi:uncharacterized protein [Diabrotica undecimpunctata]|uniref:uncharacterized protein n=1 Tax=Diabrotica undecimpunctata TaxID=50387 RepID=UPI003B635CA8